MKRKTPKQRVLEVYPQAWIGPFSKSVFEHTGYWAAVIGKGWTNAAKNLEKRK